MILEQELILEFVIFFTENYLQNENFEKISWLYIVDQWQGAAQSGIWFWKYWNRLDNLIKRADWV